MIPELGVFFLILALFVAATQAAFLVPATRRFTAPILMNGAWLQALLIALAFVTLMSLRLDSDFSVIAVVANSNLTLPTLYKIAGTWGNHEGSMLLWVLVLAGFGLALASSRGDEELKRFAIATQSAICAGFLLFILFTSNPFARRFPPTTDGEALNPLLQDIAMALHPPFLYLGYVGFSIVFSLAIAALIQGHMGREWANVAHPWILAAWSALTIGIGLGSWWAYRVLGWGGFWFWDPVENASLLPWLAGTALLHSNIVLKKRGALEPWVALLAIITFGLSLLGTFLVRSGALTSVHSFASDPARGIFILGYVTVVIGGALALFAARGGKLRSESGMSPASREGLIVINNLFLLAACATATLGTVYPLLMEWLAGERLSVGPPYFNATFLPIMFAALIMAGLSPFMPWKKAALRDALRQASPAAITALAAIFLMLAVVKTQAILAALGFGLAAWLAISSLRWLKGRNSFSVFLGHFGAAVLVAGITGATLWKQDTERWIKIGDRIEIGGHSLVYDSQASADAANYKGIRAHFSIDGADILEPEYRMYDIRQTAISVPAIRSRLLSDLYVVVGEASEDGKTRAARVYYMPMIGLIWSGFMLIALGGIVGITRRPANKGAYAVTAI